MPILTKTATTTSNTLTITSGTAAASGTYTSNSILLNGYRTAATTHIWTGQNVWHYKTTPQVQQNYMTVTFELSELYDGLNVWQCFEIFSSNQKDDKPSTLTASQLTAARAEWSKQLKEKQQLSKEKDRYQVVVDYYDID